MELVVSTYLDGDGDGESVLKGREWADPQRIEPKTLWQTSFLPLQEL